ncbi:MAG TPA: hypothetical protein VL282_02270, partial [Tepidisphaeraceae bacterium]|nr:hypothetical protein [Tepidisphaeraceae bacterium]
MERRLHLSASDFPVTVGGASFDAGQQVAVDANGNTIVAGLFSGTVDFKPGSGVVSLTSSGTSDIYIAKYSPRGKLVWVEQLGSDVDDDLEDQIPADPKRAGEFVNGVGTSVHKAGEYVNALALDASGNVYITGAFEETMDFDPGPAAQNVKAFGNEYDIFVIKLDANGALSYADRMGGEFNDIGKAIQVDASGQAYVAGYYTREADFDPTSKRHNLAALGRDDGFLMKLNSSGTLAWVDNIGGEAVDLAARDSINALSLDPFGNVFVTGTFAEESDFAPGSGKLELEAEGETDAFVAYFSHRGKLVWVKQFGGEDFDGGVRITSDANRNVYAVSYFEDVVSLKSLGSNQTITATPKDPGDSPDFTDLLITKMDVNGNLVFTRQLEGNGFELAGGFIATGNELVLSGAYYGTMLIGGSKAKLTSTLGAEDFDDSNDNDRDNSYDVFAVNYTLGGTPINATTFGSTSDDFGDGIAIDAHVGGVTQV